MRDIVNVQGSFQIAVHVKINFKRPSPPFYKRFYLVGGAAVIYRNCDQFEGELFLPFLVLFGNDLQLLYTGNAPCGPETYNNSGIGIHCQCAKYYFSPGKGPDLNIRKLMLPMANHGN